MKRPPAGIGRVAAAGLTLIFLCLTSAFLEAHAAEIIVSNNRPHQGETVAVLVRDAALPAGETPSLTFNKRQFRLFPASRQPASAGLESLPYVALADTAESAGIVNDSGSGAALPADADKAGRQGQPTVWRTLLAIPADLAPAVYEVRCGDAVSKVAIVSGQFPVQKISLPKRVVELTPAPGEMEAVAAAKATLSGERLWSGNFSAPVAAPVSARFGLRRMVNGKLLADYFHSGIDYAAPTGTPVKAPARGKVILAARGFRLHGNTVALDHGQGVVSFYLHLKTVLVKPGQIVKAGEVVGRVGQSGRASGPHLHFGLYVQEVAANPFYWYARTF